MYSQPTVVHGSTVVVLKPEHSQLSKFDDVDVRIENGRVMCRNRIGENLFPEMLVANCKFCTIGDRSIALQPPSSVGLAAVVTFSKSQDVTVFFDAVGCSVNGNASGELSIFQQRTDDVSASQYFQFYGLLTQQQNMMQDFVRTSTYQRAVHANYMDFADKVVLDVGAGSGILSFFAMQVSAKRVYAVEASCMAKYCEQLVEQNGYCGNVIVVPSMVEEMVLPELVDTIISEPMGYMLLNERMLESYVHARKFLKPGGKMFPTLGDLHFSPYSDENLFLETCSKASFWSQDFFHGVKLSRLRDQALDEYFAQPIVDTFHPSILMASSKKWSIDFSSCSEAVLHNIEIPFDFVLCKTGFIHGMAFWFEVAFCGSCETVWLSTAPTEPLTHWYQVRCQIPTPLFGIQGAHCTGKLVFTANRRLSYDVLVQMTCHGRSASNTLDLKNPFFRYNGQPTQPPPGHHCFSPTEVHYNAVVESGGGGGGAAAAAGVADNPNNYVNGMIGAGGEAMTDKMHNARGCVSSQQGNSTAEEVVDSATGNPSAYFAALPDGSCVPFVDAASTVEQMAGHFRTSDGNVHAAHPNSH